MRTKQITALLNLEESTVGVRGGGWQCRMMAATV
jgi:hypothetical protein